MTDSERALWLSLINDSDQSARAKLIELYTDLVSKISAILFAKRFNDQIEFEEYVQMGSVGLVEAVDRFRLEAGASFETFASYRIRGAILNGLPHLTEQGSQQAFLSKLRKERTDSIANDGNKEEFGSAFEEMVSITLGLAIGLVLEETGIVSSEGEKRDKGYVSGELLRIKDKLKEHVEQLPERERLIIRYHYYHGSGFDELADILGVSKGRVSQLHHQALSYLKNEILHSPSFDDYL
ncbi:MAG: sigma-70 family RNA polymerase sigma factor [Neptuniibacter sp.]